MTDTCNWPWHNDPTCTECKVWDEKQAENLDQYLAEQAAAKEEKRRERSEQSKGQSLGTTD